MTSRDAYQFDTSKPFPIEQFTKYDPVKNRMVEAKTDVFFKCFVEETNLNLYGVDIIVDERDGRHLIVDCNYFSSYAKIKNPELVNAFDKLIHEKHRQNERQNTVIPEYAPLRDPKMWLLGASVAAFAFYYISKRQ